jgi:ribose transport system substrate-binding protein
MRSRSLGLRGRRTAAGIVLSVALLPALALSACGSSDDNDSSTSATGAGASTAAASTGSSTTAAAADNGGKPAWCGDKDITLGIQDGGGLNAWSAASLQQVKLEAAKCPAVKKTIVVNAGFDPQKATSGIQSLISQGANAIVIIPDAGVCAELPALRQATQRGVKVATHAADGCGKVGTDYVSYSDWDPVANGKLWASWMAKQMGGKGNLLFMGGPAGNTVDQGSVTGILEELKKYPDIKVLENLSPKSWPVTNWDPAQAQKLMSSLLAKYPQIDGLIDGYGANVPGEIKAFKDAGRKIPPIITIQLNALSCEYAKDKGTKDAFELASISNRNWTGRLAVRHAVAAVNGIENNDPGLMALPLLEDSTQPGMEPKCYEDKGPDYDPSNEMTDEQLQELIDQSGE